MSERSSPRRAHLRDRLRAAGSPRRRRRRLGLRRRRRARLAGTPTTVIVIANFGLSTQLAALGVCLALGHPRAYLVVLCLCTRRRHRTRRQPQSRERARNVNEQSLIRRASLSVARTRRTTARREIRRRRLAASRARTPARSSTAFGMDLDTPGTRETPARFLRALYDATSGYDGTRSCSPRSRPSTAGSHSGLILEGPISFHALCEHHALPFHGDGARRICRRRGDHRHLEADADRPALRTPLHRAGTDGRADRGRARRARRAARRRRASRRGPSVHADARRGRGRLEDRRRRSGAASSTRMPTCAASSSLQIK